MKSSPQRATIVLEHASATMDPDDEGNSDENAWSVVAYLVLDSGERRRATLCRCKARADASAALSAIWSKFTDRTSFLAGVA